MSSRRRLPKPDADPDRAKREALTPFLHLPFSQMKIADWPDYAFGMRVFVLREIANDSYEEYLRTDHWRDVRLAALRRANFQCACGAPASEGHHESYRYIGCEPPEDVTAKCHGCHTRFHETWKHVARAELARQFAP